MITVPIPAHLRLHFVRVQPTDDNPEPRSMVVEARAINGDLVNVCAVGAMAVWLRDNGFQYITGTSGQWARSA